MKIWIASIFLALSTIAVAGNDNFSIDIDCDGIPENLTINVSEQDFDLSVVASSNNKKSVLTFGVGQSSRQDAICGLSPKLSSGNAATKEMHLEMFGEEIDGYKYSQSCKELVVGDDDCDPIYVFFNHKTGVLNWSRL
ncbi:hypothetical protein [Rheinheimera soli]|uniref:hypothetical protein n=1 Tax=Rheinheimera soli TaxID=443616 RepID=UPI001E46C03B|nr:hypothetical protein [Rheinheimera soli]